MATELVVSWEVIAAVGAGLTAVATSIGAATGLGWWMSGQFRDQDKARQEGLGKLSEAMHIALNSHEALDQGRHEDNLKRFAQLGERLARMGNGSGYEGRQ